MAKGIRSFCNQTFADLLPRLQELGGTAFRKAVMASVVEKFGISPQSAATHYNHSLQMARMENPEAVKDLGRPEDKRGGRPVLHGVTVINVKTGEVVVEGISRGAANLMIVSAEKANKVQLAIRKEVTEAAEVKTEAADTEPEPATA